MAQPKRKDTDQGLTTMHDVVLDYLNTQAYASTARALSIPRAWKRSEAVPGISASTNNGTVDIAMLDEEGNGIGSAVPVESGGDVDMGDHTQDDVTGIVVDEEESGIVGFLSEKNLIAMERRRAILDYILNGAIMRAIDSLNTYFPTVLADSSSPSRLPKSSRSPIPSTTPEWKYTSHQPPQSYNPGPSITQQQPPLSPSHSTPVLPFSITPSYIRLNLQIQAFIESFRQLTPASIPSSPSSSIGDLMSSSIHMPLASSVTLTNALTAAQGLHQAAMNFDPGDRALYLQEIKDVGALFAYTEPENSILRGFLEQGRRIALAEQINRAILHSQNRPTYSKVEETARRVTTLWSMMAERKVDPTPNWTSADGPGKDELAMYLRNHPKRAFSLRDFVGHSA